MEEILHQLIGSFPIIDKVLYIHGGAGFPPSPAHAQVKCQLLQSDLLIPQIGGHLSPVVILILYYVIVSKDPCHVLSWKNDNIGISK